MPGGKREGERERESKVGIRSSVAAEGKGPEMSQSGCAI